MDKNIIFLAFILVIIGAFLGIVYFAVEPAQETYEEVGKYETFSSCQQMEEFINETTSSYGYYGGLQTLGSAAKGETMAVAQDAMESAPGAVPRSSGYLEESDAGASNEYSETNIQVEGVDEADIVKTDGSYIYVLSGQKLSIIDAYPAEEAGTVSTIEFDCSPQEIFINGDKLVVLGQSSYGYPVPVRDAVGGVGVTEVSVDRAMEMDDDEPADYKTGSYKRYAPMAFTMVYDVSDRQEPEIVRNISVEGSYYDSRMIGDYVYVIASKSVERNKPVIPKIYSDGESRAACNCGEIGYFNIPDSSYVFTTILSVNTQDDDEKTGSDVYLMGYSHNLYVSRNNIYLTSMKNMDYREYQKRMLQEVIKPLLPLETSIKLDDAMDSDKEFYEKWREVEEVMADYFNRLSLEEKQRLEEEGEDKMEEFERSIAKEMEKTIVHKISIDKSQISYEAKGEVPGYVLNQFSMDEKDGYLRIATTTGNWRTEDYNHLYVLDSDLMIVGKLEDLAEGERIKSARFIGDRCYLVTFVQVDPLFVIDLSDPEDPEVLGELKVSGYSSYLHPYDEDHLIGIGKETEEGKWGPIETGVKLALFDVSDVSNPSEVDKYVIGGGWASTPVMYDHKAFLFDRDKNLLVIPAQVSGRVLGFYTNWQGAYVFDLTLEDGFELKGTISHEETREENDQEEDYYYVYRSWNNYVKRSLYIEDVLYTISDRLVKMNELKDLDEVGQIDISE